MLCLVISALIAAQEVTIEYIAHACFRLESASGASLIIDPYASRVWLGYDFPEDLDADAILITHPHYDHDAGRRRGVPFPWSATDVIVDPGVFSVGDIRVIGIRGKHADPYGKEFGQKNTIFVIEVDGIRFAHVGDNGPLSAATVREMGRIDVLMLPIDAEFHILAEKAIEAIVRDVNPRVLVPMHYRIDELETDPGSPSDLGEIGPWLRGKTNVTRLDTHRMSLDAAGLPEALQIVVLRHSPAILRR